MAKGGWSSDDDLTYGADERRGFEGKKVDGRHPYGAAAEELLSRDKSKWQQDEEERKKRKKRNSGAAEDLGVS
jgi:hypothetical protein